MHAWLRLAGECTVLDLFRGTLFSHSSTLLCQWLDASILSSLGKVSAKILVYESDFEKCRSTVLSSVLNCQCIKAQNNKCRSLYVCEMRFGHTLESPGFMVKVSKGFMSSYLNCGVGGDCRRISPPATFS